METIWREAEAGGACIDIELGESTPDTWVPRYVWQGTKLGTENGI
jgi:hypothetical protein